MTILDVGCGPGSISVDLVVGADGEDGQGEGREPAPGGEDP